MKAHLELYRKAVSLLFITHWSSILLRFSVKYFIYLPVSGVFHEAVFLLATRNTYDHQYTSLLSRNCCKEKCYTERSRSNYWDNSALRKSTTASNWLITISILLKESMNFSTKISMVVKKNKTSWSFRFWSPFLVLILIHYRYALCCETVRYS